jgi:conjugative relaxase-like TrwC/TraI family protein
MGVVREVSDCRYLRASQGFGSRMGFAALSSGGAPAVLTIGKLGTSRGSLEYYDVQVAAGAEDYYAGRGESPGQWRGAGVRALGLTPGRQLTRAEFLALMGGLNPLDGSTLRPMGARSTVAGFDLTFSAPKSVSVLFAIDDETVASGLLAAHERAVGVALAYLEREACWTRRGRNGVERLRGEGFVAAASDAAATIPLVER